MKRYRLFNLDFDSRADLLSLKIQESWSADVKKIHLENKRKIEESLAKEFGTLNWDTKIKDIKELGSSPFSIVAFHNKFFRQIRKSFIIGAYYPALTGACALGERILNHLILTLRNDFKKTLQYKKVYKKESQVNWDLMIDVLNKWDILLPDVVTNFKKLKKIRDQEAIHFNIETESKDREIALKAINTLSRIITGQFSFIGKQPWFIENTKGSFYIKRGWENKPFIKKVYIPNCRLVGPCYKISKNWEIIDDYPYENKEITDSEFVNLREQFQRNGKI